MGNRAGAQARPDENPATPGHPNVVRPAEQPAAREPPKALEPAEPSAAPQHPKLWGFFGGFTLHDLAHRGLHLGAEYMLATTTHFQSFAAAAFQAYSQPDTESGYALHARWGHRYTASFGFTFDHYIGLGVQYTRYDTTVFEFRNAVARAVERTESRIAFAPQFVFGPGYDFERLLRVPLHVYARPGVVFIYPDLNDAFQASVIAELGLRWTPEL